MSYYELIYVVRPDNTTEQVEMVTKRTGDIIAAHGGKILQTEQWGRRDLAYLVKKHAKGYYLYHVLEGGGKLVKEVESRLRIDEDVLCYQTVRVKQPGPPTPLSSEGRREIQEDDNYGLPDDDLGDDDDLE